MIVSCRKYTSVAHSSLLGYTAHLPQSREVFNINSTAIAKQHRRSIIHGSKQSHYTFLLRQCVRHAEYNILDENNVSISKTETVDLLSAECWYTPSRQHAIETEKSKMLFIPSREHCITYQRTAIRKCPLTYWI